MNPKELTNLIQQGESQRLELKQSLSSAKDLAKEVVAFANTNDGIILIGVADDGDVVGVPDFKQAELFIANMLTHNCQPQPEIALESVAVEGKQVKQVIVLRVKKGRSRPYEANHVCYLRTGSSSRAARREERHQLHLSSSIEVYDSLPIPEASLDDFSKEAVGDYLTKRQQKLGTIPQPYSERLLRKLDAITKLNGRWVPTVTGILMFAKEPQSFNHTAMCYMRAARFKGKTVGTFLDQADFYGTVPQQIDEAVEFVAKNIRFGWTTDEMPRQKRYEYPLKVVKEAITNAVAHRDLHKSAAVHVSIFDDRIEVQSPGSLPEGITIENLEDEYYQRNRHLCQRLFEMGYIEAWGLGIDMMNQEMQKAGLPKPHYKDTGNSFIVTLFGPGDKWMVEEQKPAWYLSLNERQRKAIDYVERYGQITNRGYRELNHVSHKTAHQDLSELCSKGLLRVEGSGRTTKYVSAR